MAEVLAHLTDHVLPHLPIRLWWLCLPKRLRPFLHGSSEAASAVLGIFLRALRTTLRRAFPTAPRASEIAAISVPQRVGSSLNPHYHFHILAVGGVLSDVEIKGSAGVRFHEATELGPEHWWELERVVQRRGLLAKDATQEMPGTRRRRVGKGSGGFSVDASVRIEGDDRVGIERVVRYCTRRPLAIERLHVPEESASLVSPEARLVYRLHPGGGYWRETS
jgi:hypothetical protein